MSNFDELFQAYISEKGNFQTIEDDFQRYRTIQGKEGKVIVGENLKYNFENYYQLKGRSVFDLYNGMISAKKNTYLMELFDHIENLIANVAVKYSEDVKNERHALVWIHYLRKEIERISNLKDNK